MGCRCLKVFAYLCMMANIYDIRRYGKWAFLLVAACLVCAFIWYSNNLVKDLGARERERMEIWADATKEIVNQLDIEAARAEESANGGTVSGPVPATDINFLLRIIEGNTTIPVLLTDNEGTILNHRNFELPVPDDPSDPANMAYLQKKLEGLKGSSNVIDINIAEGVEHHLYYEDSKLLKSLSLYPYVQLCVMIIFLVVVYFAVLSTKKAEQNKVWVGLSKETAHQLGTPISSLMAWMELLPDMGVDAATCEEMDKDVKRLSTIASRFSKIGSKPQMGKEDAGDVARRASAYMSTRISPRIEFSTDFTDEPLPVLASAPLFEWVMENLIKNAVDAMEGHGAINVSTGREDNIARIEVRDTGKGIPRKNWKTIFNPGYTTKKRGWGLGLTLAKRIIEQYHGGHIYVKNSVPGQGTTFRIDLPLKD